MRLLNFLAPKLLRGLERANWREQKADGRWVVHSDAFIPDTRSAKQRKDEAYETSINFYVWKRSVEELEKDGNNAANGIAVLRKRVIRQLNRKPLAGGCLKIEPDELIGNPFHGNILFLGKPPDKHLRALASFLATNCTEVLPSRSAKT